MDDVFISYSRRDKVFTQKLYEALTAANRTVWADWEDIPASSDWFAEIKQGIEETDSVLFVLSPEWIKSNECHKEMDYAVKMGKRLFPILYIPVDPKDVPPELSKINWVYMREDDDFDKGFQTLCSAMDTDLEWIKTHTRIQVRALEWEKKKRSASFALRGEDLNEGERFIAGGVNKNPVPTALQSEYILASRKDATRRQRQTLAGVTVALVISIALGVLAFFQRQEAIRQAKVALARQLSAQAQLPKNQQTSQLLAIQSMREFPIGEAAQILRTNTLGRPIAIMTYEGEISSVAFSPDGKYVVSVGCDDRGNDILCTQSSARVWEAATGDEIARMIHEGEIPSVAFSPDGKYVVSGGCDKFDREANGCPSESARVWEAATGDEIARMTYEGEISSVAFSPDGKYVVSVGCDKFGREAFSCTSESARVWEAATGDEVARMTYEGGISSVAFSPDGKYVVSGGCDNNDCTQGSARVWEAATGDAISRMTHDDLVLSVAFSPDGKYVVSGSGDGTARVWEAATGDEVSHMTYEGGVTSVAFSLDGKYIVSSGCDSNDCTQSSARVWEAAMGDEIARMTYEGEISFVAFSPDGTYVVSVGCDINYCTQRSASVWEAATGDEVARMIHEGGISSVAFSPDGTYVVSGSGDGTARVWETATGDEVARMTYEGGVTSVAFSPDGKYVVSGAEAYDNNDFTQSQSSARVWEATTGDEVARMTYEGGVTSVAFSRDGKYVVSGGCDSNDCTRGSARVWEAATGDEIARMTYEGGVTSVAFRLDGKYIVSSGCDSNDCTQGSARVWEAATGDEVARITYEGLAYAVAFSPDGKYIVSGGCDNNDCTQRISARVWEAATGDEIARMTYEGGMPFVSFSPDGKYVVSVGYDNNDFTQSSARVWEAATGDEIARITYEGYESSVAFSPDGKYVVSGGCDKFDRVAFSCTSESARVWEAATGDEISRMTYEDEISSVAFSPDGKYVISSSRDGTARVWEAATGDAISRMTHDDLVLSVAFSPDGKYVVSGSGDGTARVWAWRPEDLMANACLHVTRNLTRAEWKQFLSAAMPYPKKQEDATCPNLPLEPEPTLTPTAMP